MMALKSSGSRPLASLVESTRSQNMTVIWRRSAGRGWIVDLPFAPSSGSNSDWSVGGVPSSEMAASNLALEPTGTPICSSMFSVTWGRKSNSISLSSNAFAYLPRPRRCSHAERSLTRQPPLRVVEGHPSCTLNLLALKCGHGFAVNLLSPRMEQNNGGRLEAVGILQPDIHRQQIRRISRTHRTRPGVATVSGGCRTRRLLHLLAVGRPKSDNGMVRPCSCPASNRAGKGRQRQIARHVSDSQYRNRRDRHRYRQELVPRRGPRCARRHRAAAKVVAWPSGSAARQYTALPDRHGSLRRCTSPEPQTRIAWARCQVDAGQICPPL